MSVDWRPACELSHLAVRAKVFASIREFFAAREVLEVETPCLSAHTGTDPHLAAFSVRPSAVIDAITDAEFFLQTSPEFAMKRLLAAGSGSIFQLCKAFRADESGRYHNPEFTMLEWYRVGFNLPQLMTEVGCLLQQLLHPVKPGLLCEYRTYQQVWQTYIGLNPHTALREDFNAYAHEHQLTDAASICGHEASTWLDYLFSLQVQPALGRGRITFVYDYPATQASLARIRTEAFPAVAERFEVFIEGVELANGFHELSDADEQARRFEQEQEERRQSGVHVPRKDERLLAALQAGLPDCSGVALGVDRLLMLLVEASHIHEVLAFPRDRA